MHRWDCATLLFADTGATELKLSIFVDTALLIKAAAAGAGDESSPLPAEHAPH